MIHSAMILIQELWIYAMAVNASICNYAKMNVLWEKKNAQEQRYMNAATLILIHAMNGGLRMTAFITWKASLIQNAKQALQHSLKRLKKAFAMTSRDIMIIAVPALKQ